MAGAVVDRRRARRGARRGLPRSADRTDDPDYDNARKLYNAMIDKRPRLIAQCVDAADVIAAVKVAREGRPRRRRALWRAQRPRARQRGRRARDRPLRAARRHRRSEGPHRARAGRNAARRGRPCDATVRARRAVRDHLDDRRGRAHARRRRRSHDAQARAVDRQPRRGGRRPCRRQLRDRERRRACRTSSGRCAAAVATSVSSRALPSASALSRRSSPGRRCGRSSVPPRFSRGTGTSSGMLPRSSMASSRS